MPKWHIGVYSMCQIFRYCYEPQRNKKRAQSISSVSPKNKNSPFWRVEKSPISFFGPIISRFQKERGIYIMENIKNFFRRVRIDIIIRALLFIVMAILFFVEPQEAMTTASLIFSIFILCDGVISLVIYFMTYGLSSFIGTTLVGSIFKIVFGILFMSYPSMTAVTFGIMFAIYLIFASCNGIEDSLKLRKLGVKTVDWLLPIILSSITLLGGVLMLFFSPSDLVNATAIIAGITLLIAAAMDIILVVDMYKTKHTVNKTVKEIKEGIKKDNDDNVIDA